MVPVCEIQQMRSSHSFSRGAVFYTPVFLFSPVYEMSMKCNMDAAWLTTFGS